LKTHFTTEDFLTLVCPLYTSESVDLFRRIFEWSIVDAQDIDEERYSLGKKLSEVSYFLASTKTSLTIADAFSPRGVYRTEDLIHP
jgi:hypothetical protein